MHSRRRFFFSMRCSVLSRWIAVTALTAGITACGNGTGAPVKVTIPPKATMRIAAESLSKAGVISMPRLFRLYASARRHDRVIKAGTYSLHKDAG